MVWGEELNQWGGGGGGVGELTEKRKDPTLLRKFLSLMHFGKFAKSKY